VFPASRHGRIEMTVSVRQHIHFSLRFAARVALALAMTLSLAAIATSQPVTAQQATPILFSFGHRIDGTAAPFAVASAKGFFRTEGVSIRMDQAKGSDDAIKRVAAGERDMALVDMTVLTRYREQADAAPVKAVFMVYNQTPYAIVARKSRGIANLGDLAGKKLGITDADPVALQWPAFARLNGLDPSKVATDRISAAVREPMLAAGQIDAVTGLSFSTAVDLKDRGVPAADLLIMRFADHGSALYGHAVIVNPKLAADQPQIVSAFLRGLVKGLKFTLHDPAKAVDDALALMDSPSRELELERLRTVIRDNILTEDVKRSGLGTIDPQRRVRAIKEVEGPKNGTRIAPDALFDDGFLPPAEMLKAALGPMR
jgi:NitT/TauT family transport system substrate-binding protein